jgi:hypothetical protein
MIVNELGERGASGGLGQDQKFIDESVKEAQKLIAASNKRFSLEPLRDEVIAFGKHSQKADLLSEGGESVASDALKVFDLKRDALYSRTRKGQIFHRTATAAEINDINRRSEKAAKDLLEARLHNKSSDPSALELIHKRIVEKTNAMLNTIDGVQAANAAASGRITLRNAKHESLKRAHGMGVPLAVGAMASSHGMWDPHWYAAGIPAAAATVALRSPSALSRMAFAANDPATLALLRTAPRAASTFLPDATSTRRE